MPSLRLHEINTSLCPYPIVNTALNIQGSRFANLRRRNAGFFILTPEYTGSDATGYIATQRIEAEEPRLDLGTAMAISGAAVSPNMGAATIKALRFTSALLNIRLGYWLRNPRAVGGGPMWLKRLIDMRSFLPIKEMFGLIKETSRMVYLTDGGHIENLGVYSLMKRRCELIIAIDAEADPTMNFAALLTLERYAHIDLGAIIEYPWRRSGNGPGRRTRRSTMPKYPALPSRELGDRIAPSARSNTGRTNGASCFTSKRR